MSITIKNNDQYIMGVVKLKSYNQDMDNTLMRSYRYLDNDQITKITKEFDRELLALRDNKMHEIFSAKVSDLLKQISQKYDIKINLVESFKTLNARITSAVYYLYELQKSLEQRTNGNIQIEKLLSDILFKIGQIFIGRELKVLHLDEDLASLHLHSSVDKDLDYFYRHSKQILKDVRLLNTLLKENEALALGDTIGSLRVLLDHESQRNKDAEEKIGLAFFIFALIILIVLVHTYLKVLRNRAEVFYLAYHDTLTKLPNRAEFERYMDVLIAKNDKNKKRFIVLFIDLDRFKVINDTLGHDVGDEMLIILATRIAKVLGKENLLARLGGDEFVSIIENEKNMDTIDILVAEITSVIRKPMHIREYNLNTSASIGIAKYPDDGKTKSMLLKHADSAMYKAKDNGGDTYAFYTKELSVNMQRRLELEQELVHALEKEEFLLHYQPQYHLATGKIMGAEALIRWHSPLLGNVSPEEFINVAEDTRFIVELGYFVFRKACESYMQWKNQGIELNLIAINISSIQLRQVDAFENFKKIINETGIDAKHIEIELTERYIMEYATGKSTILR
ncbi:MAG: diguanylate cyclase [Sulfurovum sp.]|nr:diguanylate cyclase [Sulfurovum sp.]